MKRNLLWGIFLISAVTLSSCSVTNKFAGTENTGDDVYYTKAKAGDEIQYIANYNNQQNNYNADDDYYYYGDYASRINRFNYNTPFDYNDDFYYGYTPYTTSTVGVDFNYNNGYVPNYNFAGIYSPYDYGYYDFGGYDDFGYGAIYSSYLYSGGGRRNHSRYNRPVYNGANGGGLIFNRIGAAGANRTGISRGGTTNSYTGRQNNGVIYPGRPDSNNPGVRGSANGANNLRPIRADRQDTRPAQQVDRTFTPSQQPSNSSNNSGGGGGGGSSSSGGGGRPVRP